MILGTLPAMPHSDDADEAVYLTRLRAEFQRCGVQVEPDAIRYRDYLQGYDVQVGRTDLSDGQVDCLARSTLLDAVTIEFTDVRLHDRYHRTLAERPDIKAMLDAVRDQQAQWLDARGLLAALPRYQRGGDLPAFAREIEAHCGVPPGAALTAYDDGPALRFDFAEGLSVRSFTCLYKAVAVSEPEREGVIVLMTGQVASDGEISEAALGAGRGP